MANTKSAIKNARKNLRRKVQNQRVKSRLKTLAKRVKASAAGDDRSAAKEAAVAYVAALDKAAKNGIIHKNAANRRKSGCASLVSAS